MKPGPKRSPNSVKIERGTLANYRDAQTMELVQFDSLPTAPDWLTDAGRSEWLDNIGRVSSVKLITEADSVLFAGWCNMVGAAAMAWRSGEVPPSSHLMEIRKLAEMFGLAGRKSRVGQVSDDAKSGNPFTKIGSR